MIWNEFRDMANPKEQMNLREPMLLVQTKKAGRAMAMPKEQGLLTHPSQSKTTSVIQRRKRRPFFGSAFDPSNVLTYSTLESGAGS